MKEHLAHFTMPNGERIDLHKDDAGVTVTTKEHSLLIPHATGQQTLDWCALFESLGAVTKYPDEEEE